MRISYWYAQKTRFKDSNSDGVKAFLFFSKVKGTSEISRVSIFGNGAATIVQFKFAILSEFWSLRHLRERVM